MAADGGYSRGDIATPTGRVITVQWTGNYPMQWSKYYHIQSLP